MRSRVVLAILLATGVAACSSAGSSPKAASAPASEPPSIALATSSPEPSDEPVELTVFGAASLKAVLEDAREAYEAGSPGTTVTVSSDSSASIWSRSLTVSLV